jgi:hypothetical protein
MDHLYHAVAVVLFHGSLCWSHLCLYQFIQVLLAYPMLLTHVVTFWADCGCGGVQPLVSNQFLW